MTAYVSEQILFYFFIVHRKYFLYNYFLYFFLFSSAFSTSAALYFTVSFLEIALQYSTFSSITAKKNFLNMNSLPLFFFIIKASNNTRPKFEKMASCSKECEIHIFDTYINKDEKTKKAHHTKKVQ